MSMVLSPLIAAEGGNPCPGRDDRRLRIACQEGSQPDEQRDNAATIQEEDATMPE